MYKHKRIREEKQERERLKEECLIENIVKINE